MSDLSRYTDGELYDSYALLMDQRALNPHCADSQAVDEQYVSEQEEIARELRQRGAL